MSKIEFFLGAIKVEQFAILEKNYLETRETTLATELQFRMNASEKIIGVFLEFEFQQESNAFLKIEVSCHFRIQKEAWATFVDANEENLTIPKGLLAHMAMITTGTTRGILFAKTENTPYNKFILPTLDVAAMIPEDGEFSLEKG